MSRPALPGAFYRLESRTDPIIRPFLIGLTAKSIARLFPVDTSMVVIIDDRSDVWEGSRNLVKVVPCTSPPAFITNLAGRPD